jgi:hypothetical protein|tara:strand:+ start:25018 stop:26619 length:1602 start_codon:yes stop_codon:yes gene_type:complete
MGIKKYVATKDNTITNAYMFNLTTRATGASMGASDIVEVFSIYGQNSSSTEPGNGYSSELSRILIQFPVTGTTSISTDRTNGVLPASGSVSFYLKIYNARHSQTTPRNYQLAVEPLNAFWQEGYGLDMDGYTDLNYGNIGSDWERATDAAAWTAQGGDVLAAPASLTVKQKFDTGVEDLEIDITPLVEYWIAGSQNNFGVRIKLDGSYEASGSGNTSGSARSYYTKRFFGRNTEFFFKRPMIEARWDSATRDDRGNFYYSSSLAPRKDNLNTLYFHNYIRGQLKNIPGLASNGLIYISLYSGSENNSRPMASSEALTLSVDTVYAGADKMVITGGLITGKTGIYSASVAITAATTGSTVVGPLTKLFDVWHNGSGSAQSGYLQFHTGTIYPKILKGSHYDPDFTYISTIRNLKSVYSDTETARFRVFARQKNWCPTIYTRATKNISATLVDSASYKITRVIDGLEVIGHDTGSSNDAATQLSFDISGNYFDLDMAMLEPGYSYNIGLAFYNGAIGSWVDQPQTFKFRVEQDEK